ncbi:MAG: hypothetical protein IPP94_05715 [Ignavibacteria bacterium]|nr:hypothetical protein [Ignavibacteria bacterium]
MHVFPVYPPPNSGSAVDRDIVATILSLLDANRGPVQVALPSLAQKHAIVAAVIRGVLRRTLIVTPNLAAQAQWHDRYGRNSSPLRETAALLPGGRIANTISTLPLSCAPIVVMTLGALPPPTPDETGDDDGLERLVRHFARHWYGLVIFDGCDPVPARWSRLVGMLAAKSSAVVLSVLPAVYRDDGGNNVLTQAVPSLVRHGALPPFQRLAYFVVDGSGGNAPSEDAPSRAGVADPPAGSPADEAIAGMSDCPEKLEGLRAILLRESVVLQDQLRALVLTETPDEGCNQDAASKPSVLSGESVIRALIADAGTSPLHPVLLTGPTLVCHDDLVIPVLSDMQRIINLERWDLRLHRRTHGGLSEIEGDGPDWNSRTYVLFVEELLKRGISRCIVAEHPLVRDGWESIPVNTMIDLAAGGPLTIVDQQRRNPERSDPARLPMNIWSVVAVALDDAEGGAGMRRWRREQRNACAPADDGILEQGIGHVHPLLEPGVGRSIAADLSSMNSDLFARAALRDTIARGWSAGSAHADAPVFCADVCIPDKTPFAPERLQRERLDAERTRYMERKMAQHILYTLWGILAVGVIMSGFLFLPLAVGPAVAAVGACAYGGYVLGHAMRLRRTRPTTVTVTPSEGLAILARALVRALAAAGELPSAAIDTDVRVSERGGSRCRLILPGLAPEQSRVFAESFLAMLHPREGVTPLLLLSTIDVSRVTVGEAARLASYASLRVPAGCIAVPPLLSSDPLRSTAFRDAVDDLLGGARLMGAGETPDARASRAAIRVEQPAMPVIWI